MEQLLSFLVDTYDALPDKASLYAQGLKGIISERRAELQGNVRRAIGEVSLVEQWAPDRLDAELAVLELASPADLESLFERYDCRTGKEAR